MTQEGVFSEGDGPSVVFPTGGAGWPLAGSPTPGPHVTVELCTPLVGSCSGSQHAWSWDPR